MDSAALPAGCALLHEGPRPFEEVLGLADTLHGGNCLCAKLRFVVEHSRAHDSQSLAYGKGRTGGDVRGQIQRTCTQALKGDDVVD
jgi:hypothetical protein